MANILVIDDEQSIRKLLTLMLKKENHDIQTACDGKQGIRMAKELSPDLVITDLIMPEKEGLETIREIKEFNPDIKIIAISGGGVVQPEMYLKMAEKIGADHSFTKPVDTDSFLSAVNQLLGC